MTPSGFSHFRHEKVRCFGQKFAKCKYIFHIIVSRSLIENNERKGYSAKTILLLVVIAILAGIVVFQGVQISYPRPQPEYVFTKTGQDWQNFATLLSVSQIGNVNANNSENPSEIVLPLDMGNSTCVSTDRACLGYDYYFPIENTCQNTTYYGTCNFTGYAAYWFDITKNVFLTTELNISILKGQTVEFHGDWSQSDNSSIGVDDLMFVVVSTTGGWAMSATSIDY